MNGSLFLGCHVWSKGCLHAVLRSQCVRSCVSITRCVALCRASATEEAVELDSRAHAQESEDMLREVFLQKACV